jgi:glycosyltransferase involved in cell wall biosynthesis
MKNSNNLLRAGFFGCWPQPYGGIASHLHQLLPDLVKSGLRVNLFINNESDGIFKYSDKGVDIYRYCHKSIFAKYPFSVIYFSLKFFSLKKDLKANEYVIQICHFIALSRSINKNKIDFLFTHDNPRHLVVPFIRKRFPNIKIFATIYADFLLSPDKYDSKKLFLKQCFESSDLILSCSKFCCETGIKYLGIEYPMKVIYNNVDPKVFSPSNVGSSVRLEHNIPESSIVLLTMCKMNEDMGIKFLIENYLDILNVHPKLVLFFVGASDQLVDKIIELGRLNNRVKYAFNISNDIKHLYYAAGDIFTAPTIGSHACMGISNIEAMMSGLPVLSSDSGGHRETIKNNNDGFIVPLIGRELNKDVYLEYLEKLVYNSDLRKEMGDRARIRAVSLFSNDKIVEEHIALMRNIV